MTSPSRVFLSMSLDRALQPPHCFLVAGDEALRVFDVVGCFDEVLTQMRQHSFDTGTPFVFDVAN